MEKEEIIELIRNEVASVARVYKQGMICLIDRKLFLSVFWLVATKEVLIPSALMR